MDFPEHPLAYIDTETGGLRVKDQVWEVAIVTDGPDEEPAEHVFHVAGFTTADTDPAAREMARYYARHPDPYNASSDGVGSVSATLKPASIVARRVAAITNGRTLVGCNVSFDVLKLSLLLDAHGLAPEWHYTPIDATAYAAGTLGLTAGPFRSKMVADALGVERDMGTAHAALADCHYARRLLHAAHAHAAAANTALRAARDLDAHLARAGTHA